MARHPVSKAPLGPLPHFGVLGAVSGFLMEEALDTLDRVVATAVQLTGRSPATNQAWSRIARLGICQRRYPDCDQTGPDERMAHYGAIFACETCEGVVWGEPTARAPNP